MVGSKPKNKNPAVDAKPSKQVKAIVESAKLVKPIIKAQSMAKKVKSKKQSKYKVHRDSNKNEGKKEKLHFNVVLNYVDYELFKGEVARMKPSLDIVDRNQRESMLLQMLLQGISTPDSQFHDSPDSWVTRWLNP